MSCSNEEKIADIPKGHKRQREVNNEDIDLPQSKQLHTSSGVSHDCTPSGNYTVHHFGLNDILFLVSPFELFRGYSDKITGIISLDINHIVSELNAQSLITESLYDDIISVHGISDYQKAMKIVRHIQTTIKTSPNHLMKVCDVLYRHETLQEIVTDIRDQLWQQGID